MKTFPAYNIDPKALLGALKAAGQPVTEIRYRGTERRSVALACICTGDNANDASVKQTIAANSDKETVIDRAEVHIQALASGIGQKMQCCKA